MIKRIKSRIALLLTTLMVTTCLSTFEVTAYADDNAVTYKDGVYTGEAAGYNAVNKIKLNVTITNGEISAIDVISNGETKSFWNKASQTVIDRILANKSTDVDTVSGATMTSNGIINAVNDALTKAQDTEKEQEVEREKYINSGKTISKVYGVTSMTYAKYFSGELGKTEVEVDVDGLYDSVNSEKLSKYTVLPDIIYKDENDSTSMGEGISTVDVYVDETYLNNITELNEKEIADKLAEKNITAEYFAYADGTIANKYGDIIEGLPFANVKELNADGTTYAKSEKVENNNAVDYQSVLYPSSSDPYYGTAWGDIQFMIYFLDHQKNEYWYVDDSKNTSEGVGPFGFADYMNNLYTIEIVDENGNEHYALWGEDIVFQNSYSFIRFLLNFGETSQVYENKNIHRFDDMIEGGEYDLIFKSRGYDDVVLENFSFDEVLENLPKAEKQTFMYKEDNTKTPITLELDLNDVKEDYINNITKADFSMTFAKCGMTKLTSFNASEDLDVSVKDNKAYITFNDFDKFYYYSGAGYYTLYMNVPGYQQISIPFYIASDVDNLDIKVGDKVYAATDSEPAKAKLGDKLYIVLPNGESLGGLLSNYCCCYSVDGTVNGDLTYSQNTSHGYTEGQYYMFNYDAETKASYIDTNSADYFKEPGKYVITLSINGYNVTNIDDEEAIINNYAPQYGSYSFVVELTADDIDNKDDQNKNNDTKEDINVPTTGGKEDIKTNTPKVDEKTITNFEAGLKDAGITENDKTATNNATTAKTGDSNNTLVLVTMILSFVAMASVTRRSRILKNQK